MANQIGQSSCHQIGQFGGHQIHASSGPHITLSSGCQIQNFDLSSGHHVNIYDGH